jgi:hypothetical protein
MTTYKCVVLRLLLLPIFLLIYGAHGQNQWKYPIVPGTKEWRTLKSEREIIAAQQIPDDILKQMSTREVCRAWLELPGRMEILAFNTMQRGFDETRTRFNVLDELLSRADVGTAVLQEYVGLSPSGIGDKKESSSKGKFITDYALLELLVSQPEVLMSLTSPQRKFIFDKTKQDLQIKRTLPQMDLEFFWVGSGLVLGCRVLESEGIQISRDNEVMHKLLRMGEIGSKEAFDEADRKLRESTF